MSKTRERICQYYVCKGTCTKGRDAELYGICQTCSKYLPKRGAKPKRTDRRAEKLAKIQKKERWDY